MNPLIDAGNLSALLSGESVIAIPQAAALLNLLLRLFLSVVTLVSGVAKLKDPKGTRQAVRDFGLPSQWAAAAAKVLPLSEITLAGFILVDTTSRLAALCLCGLFASFCLGLARLLREKKSPPCNCFGALHSAPVTRTTLLRTFALLVLAATCLTLPTFSLTSTLEGFLSTLLGFSLICLGTARVAERAAFRDRNKGLRVGQRLPAVRTANGDWLESLLIPGRPTLLILTSRQCAPCEELQQDLSYWTHCLESRLNIVRLTALSPDKGSNDGSKDPEIQLSLENLQFFATPTPGAILLDQSGTVQVPAVSGRQAIEALIRITNPRAKVQEPTAP